MNSLFFLALALLVASISAKYIFFTVQQGVSGVTADDFKNNESAFMSAVADGIESAVPDISSDDVYDVSIYMSEAMDDNVASSVFLSYDIRMSSNDFNSTQIMNMLKVVSNNGDLESDIHSSTSNSAVLSMSLNSNEFTTYDRMTPRDSSVKLTGAQIAMLVIGIVMFLVFMGFCVGFITANKSSTSGTASPVPASPNTSFKHNSNKVAYREP
eukprot:CAMPEP_0170403506 /NCGR_PEP_ID=MMETSP0117_2-20130122/26132_1 /TAXON_ID=400756 /ORGANISM="Durinskia baltica, Strain CSIRO CS-38" /LENGTH=212 /DNA_ID=CAMNT_0010660455 /DNA_START=63 /DNA_END=701 /DNA_ORIENTATION=-